MTSTQDQTYRPILIEDIMYPIKFPFDIFVRINSREGSYKFIKRFRKDIDIEGDDLLNLQKSGIEAIYCKGSEFEEYRKARKEHKDTVRPLLAQAQKGYNKTLAALRDGDLSERTKSLVKDGIDELIHISNKYEDLNSFLNRLLDMHGAILFQHINMTAILTCEMLKQNDLIQDELKQDIITAAYLHNLTISDDLDYLMINTNQELELRSYTDKVMEQINSHAKDACEVAKKLDFVSERALDLIRCHHGNLSGIGFEDEIPQDLDMNARAFIVAERFTSNLLDDFYQPDSNIQIKQMVDELSTIFLDSKTAITVKRLKDVFINEAKHLKQDPVNLVKSA